MSSCEFCGKPAGYEVTLREGADEKKKILCGKCYRKVGSSHDYNVVDVKIL